MKEIEIEGGGVDFKQEGGRERERETKRKGNGDWCQLKAHIVHVPHYRVEVIETFQIPIQKA